MESAFSCRFSEKNCAHRRAETHTQGVFEGVARGLGCAPGSPFSCLAPFSPPPAWPARGKTTPSTWLLSYAIFHRSQRARLRVALCGRFRGALRRQQVALAGSRGRRESSSRSSPSRNPWPIKATAVASSLLSPPPHSRETPAKVSWWLRWVSSSPRPAGFLSVLPLRICSDSPTRRR
jgi:hypothetical protein